MDELILVEDIVKSYGSSRALDGLNLAVSPGQVHGFLGPNGAGKSTTIRILLGLIRHDSGRAQVFGKDPWKDCVEIHREVAYVPGDVTLWQGLTGGEVIDLLTRLQGKASPRRLDDLIQRFELDPSKRAGSYSKGNRQKVALIAAFASASQLLILDEPTSGLDPLMEQVFTDCVKEKRSEGAAVLMSSHILSEVEELCDYITIVRSGKTVLSGELTKIKQLHQTRICATVSSPLPDFANRPGVSVVGGDSYTIDLSVGADAVGEVMLELARCEIESLTCNPASLQDLFLDHYRQDSEVPV